MATVITFVVGVGVGAFATFKKDKIKSVVQAQIDKVKAKFQK